MAKEALFLCFFIILYSILEKKTVRIKKRVSKWKGISSDFKIKINMNINNYLCPSSCHKENQIIQDCVLHQMNITNLT